MEYHELCMRQGKNTTQWWDEFQVHIYTHTHTHKLINKNIGSITSHIYWFLSALCASANLKHWCAHAESIIFILYFINETTNIYQEFIVNCLRLSNLISGFCYIKKVKFFPQSFQSFIHWFQFLFVVKY